MAPGSAGRAHTGIPLGKADVWEAGALAIPLTYNCAHSVRVPGPSKGELLGCLETGSFSGAVWAAPLVAKIAVFTIAGGVFHLK